MNCNQKAVEKAEGTENARKGWYLTRSPQQGKEEQLRRHKKRSTPVMQALENPKEPRRAANDDITNRLV